MGPGSVGCRQNNPYAEIRLGPEAREAIEGYWECLNREMKRLETRPEDPVFVSLSPLRSYGERLAPNSINKIVKARARAAGIRRRITAHGLWHYLHDARPCGGRSPLPRCSGTCGTRK